MLGDGIIHDVPWWVYATPPAMLLTAGIASNWDFGKRIIVPAVKIAGTVFAVAYTIHSILPLESVGDFLYALFLAAVIILIASCVFDHNWN